MTEQSCNATIHNTAGLPNQGLAQTVAPIILKLEALAIILGSPPWPDLESLGDSGARLYYAMLNDAKPLALAIAGERYAEALQILSKWPAEEFMDETLINSPIASAQMANHRLLSVYCYYVRQVNIRWENLIGTSA